MKRISAHFAMAYPHINFQGIKESEIRDFMKQQYLDGLPFAFQMDLFADYIVANGLTEVSI